MSEKLVSVQESLWHQAMNFTFISRAKEGMQQNRTTRLTQYISVHNWFPLYNILSVDAQIRQFLLFLHLVISLETVQSMSFPMRFIWKVLFVLWMNRVEKRHLSRLNI